MRRTAALVTLALLAPACAKDGGGDADKLRIVAGMYPLAYVARAVGGDRVEVVDLTPPGAEPHDIELAPSQVAAIESADLVVVIPGLQPEVEAAARDDRTMALDVDGDDPHVWLDPPRMLQFAEALAGVLSALDRDGRFEANANALGVGLDRLDAEFRDGLKTCARKEVVTSHDAFGYLARRYGLTQIGIAGLEPDADPSPARIAEISRYVRDRKVTTVFFETLVSPKVAETVAREGGAKTAVLDPIESVQGNDDYASVMRRNLAALRTALGCT